MSDFQFEVKLAPPRLGQHNEEVLASLGYSADEIRALAGNGVV